jgi:phosphate transport system substrate-binding protein
MRGLAITAAVLPVLAVPTVASARTTLIGSGSSAEQPIMQLLFKSYSKAHKGSIRFVYSPDGGNAGVKDVQKGKSQFAVNTRPPLPSDSGTTQFKIFLDGLCVAVNPANKLSNLTLDQTKNIFLGLTTSWSTVGSNLTTVIDPIGRNSAAGSYTFFQSAVLDGQTQASNVNPLNSDGLVANAIKKDHNAIGYVGLAHSHASDGVKPLKLNGVACSQTNIKKETYPLFRYIWAVVPTKHPSIAIEKFIDWVRVNHGAGQVISRAGAVPAFNK